jgi:hypothetical protein
MAPVDEDPRVEVAARALLRYRLTSYHQVPVALEAKLGASLRRVEERLWPSLTEEARAVIKALDRAEEMAMRSRRLGRTEGQPVSAVSTQPRGPSST